MSLSIMWSVWLLVGITIAIGLHFADHAHQRVALGAFALPSWAISAVLLLGYTIWHAFKA